MNQEPGFFDKRTLIAIVLVTVVWLAWQNYISKKYQTEPGEPATNATAPATPEAATPSAAGAASATAVVDATKAKTPAASNEQLVKFEDETLAFNVSSYGMGLKDIVLKKYKDRAGGLVTLSNSPNLSAFATAMIGVNAPLVFEVKRDGNTFIGTANYNGLTVEKTMVLDSGHYTLETSLKVKGMAPDVRGLSTKISEKVTHVESSMVAPSTEKFTLYVGHGTTDVKETLKHDGVGQIGERFTNVSVASLGPLYFTRAVIDNSEIHPELEAVYVKDTEKSAFAEGSLNYLFPAGLTETQLKYRAFVGPKEVSLLTSVDPRLEQVMDYWILGAIAKPMLKIMKWFHSIVGNWGISIILLTLLVRMIVLPFTVMSFRSMKAMQKLQPQLNALREKYKDNAQALNAEMMRLFKENKVNPLGGCLPMLLQFPVFIALYRVLSNSIELYQAPFMLWIHDLSVKDPYYVLPVLMGISMFIQQKMTPTTTTDPAQQKVMMFMPVFFSFLMLSLPSGLTLYIFVSTIFGITQQLVFMKDRNATKPVTAKA